MERFVLPLLTLSLIFLVVLAIVVSVRNPPRFWMDEKRIPERQVKPARRGRSVTSEGAGGVPPSG
jgi:hypothetical protein